MHVTLADFEIDLKYINILFTKIFHLEALILKVTIDIQS
jgi:hypothetical protein